MSAQTRRGPAQGTPDTLTNRLAGSTKDKDSTLSGRHARVSQATQLRARIHEIGAEARELDCAQPVARHVFRGCDEIVIDVDCDRHDCPKCSLSGRHGLAQILRQFYNVVAEHKLETLYLTVLGEGDRTRYSDRHRKAVTNSKATGSLIIGIIDDLAIGISDYPARSDQQLSVTDAADHIEAAVRRRHHHRQHGNTSQRLAWSQNWTIPDLPEEENERANPESWETCHLDRQRIQPIEEQYIAQSHGAIPHPTENGWRFPSQQDHVAYRSDLADLIAHRQAVAKRRCASTTGQPPRHQRPPHQPTTDNPRSTCANHMTPGRTTGHPHHHRTTHPNSDEQSNASPDTTQCKPSATNTNSPPTERPNHDTPTNNTTPGSRAGYA